MKLLGRLNRKRQQGLSMIELMVALLIGTLLTAAVLQMFLGSRTTYAMQSALATMQENARFAVEFLSRDLRKAGYTGCSTNTTIANTLRDSSNSDEIYAQYDMSAPVSLEDNYSVAAGTSIPLPTSASPTAGTDIVSVKFADGEGSCTVESHVAASATIHCYANHDYQKGQVLLISDCSHSAIFQQSNTVNTNSQTKQVNHNTGQAVPGNCTKGLGLPVDCSTTLGTAYTFPTGATVQLYKNYTYYIDDNDFGSPALHRSAISLTSGTAALAEQELVEGVEDMQITYGIDNDDDGDADYYVAADTNGDGVEDLDVTEVVAIRVSLLMRSIENNVLSSAQTYSYNGATVTATDRRLRKVFTATITLRNRVI
ncbi:PilW family protein [Pontibacterium sinense]|nr:PilW family protein [Pontibacterium sinense]